MLEVLLIRHGDPDYTHDCLTATGKQEARYLADALEHLEIDAIYVSPLGRARETCEFTAIRKGMSPVVLDWLTETRINRDGACLWEAPGEVFLSAAPPGRQPDRFDLDTVMPEGREQFERVETGFNTLLATHGYVRHGELYQVEKASDKRIVLFCHKGSS